MTTCAFRDHLGAYVLDALGDEEQDAVRAHLTLCDRCRDEAGSLAGLLAPLSRLTLDEIERAVALEPAPGPDAAPPSAPPRRTPSVRIKAAVAAASLVVVIASSLGLLVHGLQPAGTYAATLRAADSTTGVVATLTVFRAPATTHLHLSLQGAYPRGTCDLVVRDRDGRSGIAATWTATSRGAADVDTTTPVPPSRIAHFDVLTASGRLLVRLRMPGDHP
jgi:Putative zinc-finger